MNKQLTIDYPVDESILYMKEPRILMTLPDDIKKENAIIYITLDNESGVYNYTSIKNAKYFSAIAFKANRKIAFYSPDMVEGRNRFYISVYHDTRFSEESIIDIVYVKPKLTISNIPVPASADNYKMLLDMANSTLIAYGQEQLDIQLPIANETKIDRKYFSKINNKLYYLNNWINDTYPGLARLKEKKIISFKCMSLDIWNALLDLVLNL